MRLNNDSWMTQVAIVSSPIFKGVYSRMLALGEYWEWQFKRIRWLLFTILIHLNATRKHEA